MADHDTETLMLEEAVQWAVRLASGTATDDDYRAFSRWRDANSQHRTAWESVEHRLNVFAAAREHGGAAARRVLTSTRMSRRKLLRDSMTVLGVFGVLGGAGKVLGVFDSMTADFATDIGKRRQIVLEDSSLLTLDGGSAVDIDFDGGERAVRLIKGRLFVSVAHDVNRPFIIYTRDGACKSLGTEFGVGLGAEGTRLAVTRSAVQAQAASGGALNVKAGQVATLLRSGRINLEPLQADAESTWVKGFITAVDRPLSEIVEALNRYLPGLIVLSEDAASLRISGLFLLDDAQSSIRQIAQTLPVVVTYHTAYLIRISLDSVGRSSST